MAAILREFMTIAAIPSATMLIKNTMIAMSTIQVPSPPIERAAWQNNLVLAGYITALVIAALMTFLSWYFGGRLQGLIRRDADARIAEADSKAAGANERAAVANAEAAKANEGLAKANAEVARLTKESLQTQFNLEKTKTGLLEARANVFDLQKAASDAKAAQQRVEIDLARQRERAANAERTLEAERLERKRLEEVVTPRRIVSGQVMVEALTPFKGTDVIIECASDDDSRQLEAEISSILKRAGWNIIQESEGAVRPNIRVLAPFFMDPASHASNAAMVLIDELQANRLEVLSSPTMRRRDTVTIEIGRREATYLIERQMRELGRDFIFGEPTDATLEPLREQILFSHFTEAQQHLFIGTLEKSKGAMPIQIRCPANDDEACAFAMEIGVLLRRAGWRIERDSVMRDKGFPSMTRDLKGLFPGVGTRIAVVARWRGEGTLDSSRIAGTFEAIGFSVQRTTDLFDPAAPILVVVYSKK